MLVLYATKQGKHWIEWDQLGCRRRPSTASVGSDPIEASVWPIKHQVITRVCKRLMCQLKSRTCGQPGSRWLCASLDYYTTIGCHEGQSNSWHCPVPQGLKLYQPRIGNRHCSVSFAIRPYMSLYCMWPIFEQAVKKELTHMS